MTPDKALLLVFAFALFCVVAIIVVAILMRSLRARSLARAARELGMAFAPPGPPFTLAETTDNSLLSYLATCSRGASLRGPFGPVESVVFDYEYKLRAGFHSPEQTFQQTVAAFRCLPAATPEFSLSARTRLERKLARVAPGSIGSDFNPDFPHRYGVTTQEEGFLRAFLNPGKLQALMDLADQDRWMIWASGEWMALYRPQKVVRAGKLRTFLEQAWNVAAALKG